MTCVLYAAFVGSVVLAVAAAVDSLCMSLRGFPYDFGSVVLAVAAAVDCLCMSLCGCLCVLLFALGTKAALMCANLHRTTTQPTCWQYDFTIMREISIAGGHTASNAPDLFRPPKLSGAGPG